MIVRFVLGLLLVLSSLFLILLVLIQRGRGGGLAGAFGGAGGQSAFGTKAGDVFTKITIGVATFWILLCILAFNVLGRSASRFDAGVVGGSAPVETGTTVEPPAGGAPPESAAPAESGTGTGGDAADPAASAPAAPATEPAAEAPPAGEAPAPASK